MPLITLDAAEAEKRHARCLDGSPPGFYYRPGQDAKRWVVYLKGGGLCYDDETCLASARSPYGSTTLAPRTFSMDGILSTDTEVNPLFAGWRHAVLWYCDAYMWGGDRQDPQIVTDSSTGSQVKLYREGRNVLHYLLDSLKRSYGLNDASEVLVVGDCAGGVASISMGATIALRLPWAAKVRLVSTSGYLYSDLNVYGGERFHALEAMALAQPRWPARCEDKLSKVPDWFLPPTSELRDGYTGVPGLAAPGAHGLYHWKCASPAVLYSSLELPLFMVETVADSCALDQKWLEVNGSMLTSPGGCLDREGDLRSCQPYEAARVQEYADKTMSLLRASGKVGSRYVYPRGGVDGGFIHTCLGHADALRKNGPYKAMAIDGVSLQSALQAWYLDDAGNDAHWHLPCQLNTNGPMQCNPTCAASWASVGAPNQEVMPANTASPLHLNLPSATPASGAGNHGLLAPYLLLVACLLGLALRSWSGLVAPRPMARCRFGPFAERSTVTL